MTESWGDPNYGEDGWAEVGWGGHGSSARYALVGRGTGESPGQPCDGWDGPVLLDPYFEFDMMPEEEETYWAGLESQMPIPGKSAVVATFVHGILRDPLP